MREICEYSYPSIGINDAVEYITLIVKKHGGKISLRGLERRSLGEGWLNSIISSLKDYELIEGKGVFSATDIVQTIVLLPIEERN